MNRARTRALLRRAAQVDLRSFVEYTFNGKYAWNWHHEVIVEALEDWISGKTPRLILSVEPRAGKSQLVSRHLPAFLLGQNPRNQIISVTYGQRLSNDLSKDVQRIMRETSYQEVFPATELDEQKVDKFTTSAGGVYLATSIGGAMAGFGANYLIIDDPIKDRKEAESPTVRKTLIDSYNNDIMTRLIHPASVLIMNTRWHLEDLQGYVLSLPDADKWRVLNIPSVAVEPVAEWDPRKPGDPIWPRRYVGLGTEGKISDEEARATALAFYEAKKETDAYVFSSLYQGNPTPSSGGLFKRAWFDKQYTADPAHRATQCDEVIISVDAAFAGNKNTDPVECLVLGRQGRYIYVLDEVNRRMDFPSTLRALEDLQERWPMAGVLIEAKANGQALVDTLRERVGSIIEFHPGNTNKVSRAHSATHRLEAGDVIFPRPVYAPWLSEFVEDFAGFGVRRHDDRVDAFAQACIYWNSREDRTQRWSKANKGLKGLAKRIASERDYGRFW